MNQVYKSDVSQQAAVFLKLTVNNCWETSDQQNTNYLFLNSDNARTRSNEQQFLLQSFDKEFLKSNIFLALDSVIRLEGEPSDQSNKSITQQIENVIWNIAQYDY